MDGDGFEFESWFVKHWRPYMAWCYMVVCMFDFLIGPIFWTATQAYLGQPLTAWVPLTIGGAGIYHMAMGGIIGVTAWSRGQEKLKYMETGVPAVVEPVKK